ncbi:NAD-dependent epimerase/dehydratase family protein [Pseudomonadota bacterium]
MGRLASYGSIYFNRYVLMKILVTGATGFIGNHLCDSLQSLGHQVFKLSRTSNKESSNVIHMELGFDKTPDCFPRFDAIFHLAGKTHDLSGLAGINEYRKGNVVGTEQLLKVAAGAKFIFFSSLSVMPSSDHCLDEDTHAAPTSHYGKSKFEAESLIHDWVKRGGNAVILRPAMVYGETNKGNLPKMIHHISKGYFPPINVQNRRSMVHVDDVVQAAILSLMKPEASGNTYIVTDGMVYSTTQIFKWICETLGKPIPRWFVPLSILQVLAHAGDMIGAVRGKNFIFNSNALDKLTSSAEYSCEKIKKELGFIPQKNLRDSLPSIVKYLLR